MKIFLDTSFIAGLILPNDTNYPKAEKLIKNDNVLNNTLYSSNYVIDEIITLIGSRTNLELAEKGYYLLIDNCIILNEGDIDNFNNKTLNIYKKYNTNLSFTDCSIINLMNHYNIKNLLTFDKYFKKVEGINVID